MLARAGLALSKQANEWLTYCSPFCMYVAICLLRISNGVKLVTPKLLGYTVRHDQLMKAQFKLTKPTVKLKCQASLFHLILISLSFTVNSFMPIFLLNLTYKFLCISSL